MARLLYLQFKRAFFSIPRLLLGALLPLLLAVLVFLFAQKLPAGSQGALLSPVALVNYDAKADLDFMLPYFSDVDASAGYQFLEMDEETAMRELAAGTVCAVLIFPENMLSGILDATNIPARLYLPKNSAIASLFLASFARSGAMTLSAAQSCIYAATDLYREYGLSDHFDEIYADINLATMHYALAREELFSVRSVSATGTLSLFAYYGATLALCLTLFFCSGMGNYLCRGSKNVLRQQLSRNGIGPLAFEFSLLAPLFFVCLLFSAAIFCTTAGILRVHTVSMTVLSFLFAAAFCLSLLVQFVFRLFQDTGRGILVFLFGGLFMIFLSGGFLPYAFLPVLFQRLTSFLPLGAILNGLRHWYANALTSGDVLLLLWHSVLLVLLMPVFSLFTGKEADV